MNLSLPQPNSRIHGNALSLAVLLTFGALGGGCTDPTVPPDPPVVCDPVSTPPTLDSARFACTPSTESLRASWLLEVTATDAIVDGGQLWVGGQSAVRNYELGCAGPEFTSEVQAAELTGLIRAASGVLFVANAEGIEALRPRADSEGFEPAEGFGPAGLKASALGLDSRDWLYVASEGIVVLDTSGVQQQVIGLGLITPGAFVMDESRDRLYVYDSDGGDIAVFRMSDGSLASRFGTFPDGVSALDIDQFGYVYVASAAGPAIHVIAPGILEEAYTFDVDTFDGGALSSLSSMRISVEDNLMALVDAAGVHGVPLTTIQEQLCLRTLRVSGPTRAVAGATTTLRVEVLQPDGGYDRLRFREQARVWAERDGETTDLSVDTIRLYSGLGILTVKIDEPGEIDIFVEVGGVIRSHRTTVMESPETREVSGALEGAGLSWNGDEIIHLTGVTTVPASQTLEIEAGALVMMGPDAVLEVLGSVSANGTYEAPIYFFAADAENPWSQIWHRAEDDAGTANYTHTMMVQGGTGVNAGETRGHCCAAVFHAEQGNDVTFEHVVIADSLAKATNIEGSNVAISDSAFTRLAFGPELRVPDGKTALIERSFFTNTLGENTGADIWDGFDDHDGIYVWQEGDITIQGCVAADIGDDGVDIQRANPRIIDTLIYRVADKGISVTASLDTTVEDVLISDCTYGIKIDGDREAQNTMVRRTTIVNQSMAGFWVSDRRGDYPDAVITPTLEGVIIWNAPMSIETNYTPDLITMNRSSTEQAAGTSGGDNVVGDPLFFDAESLDFRVRPYSPTMSLGTPPSAAGWHPER